MYNKFNLTGKVVSVVGGNSGIGLGMVKALASAGATVIVGGRDHNKNMSVGEEVQCDYAYVDATDEAAVKNYMDYIIKKYNRLDACFVVAGGPIVDDKFENSSLDTWNLNFKNNVSSVYLCFREASKHMIDLKIKGSLVSVSSIMVNVASPTYEAYSSAKAGVEGLTNSLCKHLGEHDIRINTIAPGVVNTPATKIGLRDPELRKYITNKTMFKRLGEPEDFGGLAVYLASDASMWHTGSTLLLDGGISKNLI